MIIAPTTGQRVVVSLLAPLVLVLLLCMAWILLNPLRHLLGAAGWVIFLGFAGSALGVTGYLVVRAYRTVIWLEGSELVVRGAVTTRRCDLGVAAVRVAGANWLRGAPVLQAQQPGAGRWLQTPLRTRSGELLDPVRLRALANAIRTGERPDPARAQAAWVAHGLEQLAANPAYHLM